MQVEIQEVIKGLIYFFAAWIFANVAIICSALVWIIKQIIKYHDLNKKVLELDQKAIKFEKDINGIGFKLRDESKAAPGWKPSYLNRKTGQL